MRPLPPRVLVRVILLFAPCVSRCWVDMAKADHEAGPIRKRKSRGQWSNDVDDVESADEQDERRKQILGSIK